jgi:carbonic anhydrase
MTSSTAAADAAHRDSATLEKPANGKAGLRHWRTDLLAGLAVSLVSLPLSSGIAIASGAPPIYGIISAIIAGLVFPFVGGSFVTISGPAAGLAPALLATMAHLGGAGSADHVGAGYPMLLVVISAVGVAQIVLAQFGLARFAAIFPASVVEGMLAAIGMLILVKALPLALGVYGPVHAHDFLEYVGSIPHWIEMAEPRSIAVSAACLAVFGLLATATFKRVQLFKVVPAHVFAVVVGASLAAVLGLSGDALISVPANPLSGLQLPAFGQLAGSPDLWKAALIGFVTLTLIDGVESLATAQAVDRIDPFKRKSEPNRVLRAMGISNLVSSLLGGLTVIPGGVKSKTCIEAGGRTLWANFANAVFLLAFLFVAPGLVSLIPKAALGAILIYTGWKMAHPRIAREVRSIGVEQLSLYGLTIAVTLVSDLLIGVLAGTAAKLLIVVVRSGFAPRSLNPRLLADVFRDPVVATREAGGVLTLELGRPLVCFNAYKLIERLDRERANGDLREVVLEVGERTPLIDHTALDAVEAAIESAAERPMRIVGLEALEAVSGHHAAMRVRPRMPLSATGG